jgi:hypothetical protein
MLENLTMHPRIDLRELPGWFVRFGFGIDNLLRLPFIINIKLFHKNR